MEKIYLEVGRKIKEKRQELGLSQEALSDLSGVSSKFISDIERGVKKPSLATVHKILSALDIDTSIFDSNAEKSISEYNALPHSSGETLQFFIGGSNFGRVGGKSVLSSSSRRNKDLTRWALLWKKLEKISDEKREKVIAIVEKLISSL